MSNVWANSISSAAPITSTLTLTTGSNGHENLSVEDLRRFKEMCGLLDYIASVDPKFKEYVTAYRAKKRILERCVAYRFMGAYLWV